MHRTADDDDSPSSPELSLEALEKRGLAVLVSFKNDDLIRRSNVSFLSLLGEHSSSSLSSLADVAMAEDHMVSHAVLGSLTDHFHFVFNQPMHLHFATALQHGPYGDILFIAR
jgi:hypothetical protein